MHDQETMVFLLSDNGLAIRFMYNADSSCIEATLTLNNIPVRSLSSIFQITNDIGTIWQFLPMESDKNIVSYTHTSAMYRFVVDFKLYYNMALNAGEQIVSGNL